MPNEITLRLPVAPKPSWPLIATDTNPDFRFITELEATNFVTMLAICLAAPNPTPSNKESDPNDAR